MNTNTINLTPAFTTLTPSHKVSEKYKFISTAQFIQDMQSLGWTLDSTRSPRKGFGAHSMFFSSQALPQMQGRALRLFVTNSHDGSSAFKLAVGFIEFACSNGLIVGTGISQWRVLHRGYALDKVSEALMQSQARFEHAIKTVKSLQSVEALPEQTAAFLTKAVELRDAKPMRIVDLTAVRHAEQSQNNAWNVFNRVQESLIRGGYSTAVINDKGQTEYGPRAREIKAVREVTQINQSLWNAAVEAFLPKSA